MQRPSALLAPWVLLFLLGFPPSMTGATEADVVTAIVNVNVLPMDGERVLAGHTVLSIIPEPGMAGLLALGALALLRRRRGRR